MAMSSTSTFAGGVLPCLFGKLVCCSVFRADHLLCVFPGHEPMWFLLMKGHVGSSCAAMQDQEKYFLAYACPAKSYIAMLNDDFVVRYSTLAALHLACTAHPSCRNITHVLPATKLFCTQGFIRDISTLSREFSLTYECKGS